MTLRLPISTTKLPMTDKVRKKAAKTHFSPYKVLISGADKNIKARVAGTRNKDEYFTDEVKMVFRSCLSFEGSIFEKAGNKTVCIGYMKKVRKTAKLDAILKLPIMASSTDEAITNWVT